jgi:hypothetical protein
MASPFTALPTLAEFVAYAKSQGCSEFTPKTRIIGPRGEARVRCLIGRRGIPVVLPDIAEDDHLMPTELGGLCRALGIEPPVPLIRQ